MCELTVLVCLMVSCRPSDTINTLNDDMLIILPRGLTDLSIDVSFTRAFVFSLGYCSTPHVPSNCSLSGDHGVVRYGYSILSCEHNSNSSSSSSSSNKCKSRP